jgi:hypothetical protein
MLNAPARTVLLEITEFLATNPTPEAIIAYRLPAHFHERALALTEKNGEDELTPEEHEEMMDFVRADQMMSLLKARMRAKLQKPDA